MVYFAFSPSDIFDVCAKNENCAGFVVVLVVVGEAVESFSFDFDFEKENVFIDDNDNDVDEEEVEEVEFVCTTGVAATLFKTASPLAFKAACSSKRATSNIKFEIIQMKFGIEINK